MNRLRPVLRKLVDWALRTEASTRLPALLRIGLALLLWTRWAGQMMPIHHAGSTAWLALSSSFYASTTLMFCGIFSRATTAWAGMTALLIHYTGPFYFPGEMKAHHTHLLAFATFLCAFTPCGKSYSLDRWLAVRRAERRNEPPPLEKGNLWAVRLIALQMSAVYLWSAYDKLHWGFLSGERLEHLFRWYYLGSNPMRWAGVEPFLTVAASTIVALEIALGVGLLFGRTRRWLVIPGMLMHALFYLLLPVRTFTATVWLLYLAYFDADALHRNIDRLSGHTTRDGPLPKE